MPLIDELKLLRQDRFIVLIFDNEVTVGEFVMDPPLPWTRLMQRDGVFCIAEGYPTTLTRAQAQFEMKNWDTVSLSAIARLVAEAGVAADMFVFGNNAGQGLPLAKELSKALAETQGAVIYATGLPEMSAYERLGYRNFWRRKDAISHLLRLAESAARPLQLWFVNTIQHNTLNYHDP